MCIKLNRIILKCSLGKTWSGDTQTDWSVRISFFGFGLFILKENFPPFPPVSLNTFNYLFVIIYSSHPVKLFVFRSRWQIDRHILHRTTVKLFLLCVWSTYGSDGLFQLQKEKQCSSTIYPLFRHVEQAAQYKWSRLSKNHNYHESYYVLHNYIVCVLFLKTHKKKHKYNSE